MKLAVYSTKQYDKKYLQQVNESHMNILLSSYSEVPIL